MQRKEFIKRSLFATLALNIPGMLTSCKKENLVSDKRFTGKVLVLGAGASGLYSASLMLQRGATVTVLEASNSIGGRIKSLQNFTDYAVELGAEEVHGNKSSWYTMVKNAGVDLYEQNGTDFYQIDNTFKSEVNWNTDTDYNLAQTFITQATNYIGTDKTVEQQLNTSGIANRVHHFINAQVGNEYGTSNSRLSIKGITEEDQLWTSGNKNYVVKNGTSYQNVLQNRFADAISKVLLNSVVTDINYTNAVIKVTCANGKVYECDKLIITVPVAILKSNSISFFPVLPSSKTDAIDAIGMGTGMKIILKFSSRFWDADLGSIYGKGYVPEFWNTGLGKSNSPVLTAFVMGQKAEYLSTQGANAVNIAVAELDSMYGPGVASGKLINSYILDWGKEPFIKGTYSFPIVNGGITKRKNLSLPVDGKLFFAGEATNYNGHSATVHGAIETAERAVNELLATV